MNKIAVTGANGMAGSHLVCMLESQKIPVKAITRKEWDLTEWKSFAELDEIFDTVHSQVQSNLEDSSVEIVDK